MMDDAPAFSWREFLDFYSTYIVDTYYTNIQNVMYIIIIFLYVADTNTQAQTVSYA